MTDSHDTTGDSGSAGSADKPDGAGTTQHGRWENLPPRRVLRASSRPNFRGDKPTGTHSAEPASPETVRPTPASEHHSARDLSEPFPSRRELREQREREEQQRAAQAEETAPADAPTASGTPAAATSTAAPPHTAHRDFDENDNAQPRHGERSGEGFPSIVTWTTLGTMLPGLAILRRNRRSIAGWILLCGFVLGIAAIVITALIYGPTAFASRVVSSPKILRFASVVLLIGLVIWVLVILRSFAVSKRGFRLPKAQKVLSWVLVASLIAIVGIPLSVGAAYANVTATTLSKVFGENGAKVLKREDLWADQERINVFLIGQDSSDTREGVRPDTMLVASIDTRNGQTTLISVPRNLAFPEFPEDSKLAETFPNGFRPTGDPTEDLINAVWDWAENSPEAVGDTHGLEPGMFATIQAVEASLGLNTDYWTAVNMQGFTDLITTMGGVELDVERPIPMGGGTNQHTGAKNQIFDWIDPGPQRLEGKKALWYTRSRDGADNYDRMCRQQRFLKAALEQLSPQEMALKYPQLAASASDNIRTDIPLSDLSAFADLAMVMRDTEVKSAQITNDVVNTLHPDYDDLREWVKKQTSSEDGKKKAGKAPTDGSTGGSENTDSTPEDSTSPSEEPQQETETTEPGIGMETDGGKCYPHGYKPGDPWPGYPHNDKLRGGANAGTGADG
ncbi:LCP family protein [Brevibacterium ravenspurgense]|uniref:LCP family protein n=1 Tax=Brevibacterium ravenspurgense TaxID=479117 RepID=UPI001EF33C08|nr:LCP family protein [Brevibacterium ravenspurgense]